MKKYPMGKVIVEPSAQPETAEHMARRIFNMSLDELADRFLAWQEEEFATQRAS